MAYVILTEDGVDQIVETEALAKREKRDLEKMGCTVRLRKFKTMAEAEDWADKQ